MEKVGQSQPKRGHLVVTVHGIRTFGKWQERLEALLLEVDRDVVVNHLKYGYFSVLAFLVPVVRRLAMRRIRRLLLEALDEREWDRIDVVCHSFGTYLVTHALLTAPPDRRRKIHTLILAGSVLKKTFNWSALLARVVGRVVNDCGTKDTILILSQIGVLFTGMAGREGFEGRLGPNLRNRYHAFGHSGYFEQPEFMSRWWVPLLTAGDPVPSRDERRVGLLAGWLSWGLGYAEPLKIVAYGALIILVVMWFRDLGHDRRRTLAKQLGAQAELLTASEPHKQWEAIALALRGLSLEIRDGRSPHQQVVRGVDAAWGSVQSGYPLRNHSGHVEYAEFSRDGRLIVTASADGTARVWRVEDRKEIATLDHADDIEHAEFSPDGRLVLTVAGLARIWRVADEKRIASLGGADAAAFSPDGRYIVTANDKTVRVFGVEDGQEIARCEGHTSRIEHVDFSPDGRLIVSAGEDETARIWRAEDGTELMQLVGHTDWIEHVEFSADGHLVVTASYDNTARIWRVEDGEEVAQLTGHTEAVEHASFSPDGRLVVTASSDDTARLWRVEDGRQLSKVEHSNDVVHAEFSPGGRIIATASKDTTAQICSAEDGTWHATFDAGDAGLRHAAFSPDSSRLVIVGDDGTAFVRTIDRGTEVTRLAHDSPVTHAEFSPDGRLIATAGDSAWLWRVDDSKLIAQLVDATGSKHARFSPAGTLVATTGDTGRVWRVEDAKQVAELVTEAGVGKAEFSADGRLVATCSSSENVARIWRADNGQPVAELTGHTDSVWDVEFSPDGRHVVTAGGNDKTARIWQAESGEEVARLVGHPSTVIRARFSPDGRHVVTAGFSDARLWRVDSGEEVGRLEAASAQYTAFSPDGRYVVTCGTDDARIWKVGGDLEVIPLAGHGGLVWRADFSPDSRLVVTADGDGTARLFRVEDGREMTRFEGHTWIAHVEFSPDGRFVLTAGSDGTARLWLTTLRGRVGAAMRLLQAQPEWSELDSETRATLVEYSQH